jgi:hypothetical protein
MFMVANTRHEDIDKKVSYEKSRLTSSTLLAFSTAPRILVSGIKMELSDFRVAIFSSL